MEAELLELKHSITASHKIQLETTLGEWFYAALVSAQYTTI